MTATLTPTLTPAKPQATSATDGNPVPWTVTREQYYAMAEQGYFAGTRVERIHGRIVIMSPIGWKHGLSVDLTADILRNVFAVGYYIRQQNPMPVPNSDPEPDVAIYPGSPRDYQDHPSNAILLVEVADTSLKYDTGKKAALYASHGVADYWVVDLEHRRVLVFRDPKPDASSDSGFSYFSLHTYLAEDQIAPLAAPQAPITVADLLP